MSLYKKILTLVLAATFVVSSTISSSQIVKATDFKLPPDIQMEKSNFDSFEQVTEKYTTNRIIQVNNQEERIQSISFVENLGDISGVTVIDIPEDIARVMHFFYRIDILGTGIKDLKVTVETPVGSNALSEPWRGDNHIQGRTAESFKVDRTNLNDDTYKGWKMTIEGAGNVSKIQLFEQNGLPVSYDITAYTVLGSDKPIVDSTISVNATDRLSMEGLTKYEEEKFKSVAAAPIGSNEGDIATDYYTEQNFISGRQMFKFRDALEHAFWVPNQPVMGEDPNKEGYSDYSFFDQYYKRNDYEIKRFDNWFDSDLEFVLCYDNWPSWMWREGATGDGHRGTPDVKYFDAAAELAAMYTKATIEQYGGRTGKWIEVKNESTIASEWGYHFTESDSWKVLADFHNVVADKVREVNPGSLVGGPTAAWMAFDHGNFSEARKNLEFMDNTKGKMDFYSYHFYEGSELIVNETDSNYIEYLAGRLEADFDLLRNHMILTDNLKPLVISETGALHSGPTDPDLFIKLKTFNAYTIRYMNRANEIDVVVPFLIPITWWDKGATDNLILYDADGNKSGLTKMKYFIDAWAEYNGQLLPAFSDNDKIFTHSAQDGNVMYVSVNNLDPHRVNLDLDIETGDAEITKIERIRTYLELGEIIYTDEEIDSLDNLPLAVEETTIFKITLDKAPTIDNTLLKTTYYGDSTLKPTGEVANFVVKTPTADIDSSVLRVSIAKENGFKEDLKVSVNGTEFVHDLSFSDKPDRYFGYIDFVIPNDVLKESNSISVDIPESGGTISTVAIINHYKKAAPTDEILANVSDSNMTLDGKPITLKAYNIDGTNHFDLNALAVSLNGSAKQFNIGWDEDDKVYNVISNEAYSKDYKDPVNSNGFLRYVEPADNCAYVDGVDINATAYTVQGVDYYKLRDICKTLDIHVGFDEETSKISLDTSKSYDS